MQIFVVAGVLIYLGAMIGIAVWSSRQVKNLTDFLVAGRKLSFPIATATLFATWFGAGSLMGASGVAYESGILGVVSDPFAAGVALILAGLFFTPILRRMKFLTITDLFGKFYGQKAEIFASGLMIPVYVSWLGAQMVALGFLFRTYTSLSPEVGIVLGALIVLAYTYAGGMWAVTLTDVIQVSILILGIFVLFPRVIVELGGMHVLIQSTPPHFWDWFPKQTNWSGWSSYLGQWVLMGLGTIVGQDLIQRSLASKNEWVAKTSAISAGVAYILMGVLVILLGFAGRILLPGVTHSENIIPLLANQFLPPVLLTLFLGAVVSAIMSSADSSLLAGVSLFTNNIYQRLNKKLKQKELLQSARWATIVMTILSMGLALYVQQIYNLMVNSWAFLLVGIFVPATMALYWKKANREAAWAAMVLGTLSWLGHIAYHSQFFQNMNEDLFYAASCYGGLGSLLAYVGVTFWFRQPVKKLLKLLKL